MSAIGTKKKSLDLLLLYFTTRRLIWTYNRTNEANVSDEGFTSFSVSLLMKTVKVFVIMYIVALLSIISVSTLPTV